MQNDLKLDVFEGVEKRIVIQLKKDIFENKKIKSLFDIEDELWNEKLNCIGCTIISKINNNLNINDEDRCKAYLLSESSLFLYADKLLIKTCGKTKLLFFIPILVDILMYKFENKRCISNDCFYNENFFKFCELTDIIEFIKNSFEYVIFTHMNYQNATEEGIANIQEYPHKTVSNEYSFFSIFFSSVSYNETSLPFSRSHYVFFARPNCTYNKINHKFCSEIILFSIKHEYTRKGLQELYLNDDSLNLFYEKERFLKLKDGDVDDDDENNNTTEKYINNLYKKNMEDKTIDIYYSNENSEESENNKNILNDNQIQLVDKEEDSSINELSDKNMEELDDLKLYIDTEENSIIKKEDNVLLIKESNKNNINDNENVNKSCLSYYKNERNSSTTSTAISNKILGSDICKNEKSSNEILNKHMETNLYNKINNNYLTKNNMNYNYQNEYAKCLMDEGSLQLLDEKMDNMEMEKINKENDINSENCKDIIISYSDYKKEESDMSSNEKEKSDTTEAYNEYQNKCIEKKEENNNSQEIISTNYKNDQKYYKDNTYVELINEYLFIYKKNAKNFRMNICNKYDKEHYFYNEYHFTPCGFSCNAVSKNNYFSVHHSPEKDVSYVSIEVSNLMELQSFVKFKHNQLNFYEGKYIYIINYIINENYMMEKILKEKDYIMEKEYESDANEFIFNTPLNEYIYVKNNLSKDFVVGNNKYKFLFYNELKCSFLVIQYFTYQMDNECDETNIKVNNEDSEDTGNTENTENTEIKEVKLLKFNMNEDKIVNYFDYYNENNTYEKLKIFCYKKAYEFCKKNNIIIVDTKEIKDSFTNKFIKKYFIKWNKDNFKENFNGINEMIDNIVNKKDKNNLLNKNILEDTCNKNNKDYMFLNKMEGEKKYLKSMFHFFKTKLSEMYIFNEILYEDIDNSVLCINLEKVLCQYLRLKKNIPYITPYYSMKSNNDETLIRFLYELNCNFDCASIGEIKKLTSLCPDISRDRIIYANTIKSVKSLLYAKSENVNLCTFDNLEELKKIALYYPQCKLIIRINVDFSNYKSYMSSKYGTRKNEWKDLLTFAKLKKLNIVGVSFHVGSNSKNMLYYCQAIKLSREIWQLSESFGFHMNILDIGGGFPEQLEEDLNLSEEYITQINDEFEIDEHEIIKDVMDFINGNYTIKEKHLTQTFEKIALVINTSINYYFGNILHNMKIICEPGRYISGGSSTLAVKIVGKKYTQEENFIDLEFKEKENIDDNIINVINNIKNTNEKLDNISNIKKEVISLYNNNNNNNNEKKINYYVNDSIYGCFSNIIFDEYNRSPIYIVKKNNNFNQKIEFFLTKIFGQSCDGLDLINSAIYLPECDINDWLIYEYFGAYSFVSASNFNSFKKCKRIVIFSKN